MNIVSYKCPNCGAPLKFNAESQNWDCEFCLSSFDVETLEKLLDQSTSKEQAQQAAEDVKQQHRHEDFSDKVRVFSCPSCGGQVLADENTAATFCIFCHNPAIVEENLSGEFRPAQIIPFKTTKEDATNAFRKLCRKRPLLPGLFHQNTNIEKITGLYVPFWLYSCHAQASLSAAAQRISRWSDSNYNYTKTDYYEVFRSGKMDFSRVPADGSKKMDNDLMDSLEPYQYADLKEFSMAYLSGYLAEKYDMDDKETYPRARERMTQTAKNKLRETIQTYDAVQIRDFRPAFTGERADYVLLPVWMLNTRYKGKDYLFAMNGQTGKIVGNLPISVPKLIGWFGLITGVVLAILTIGGILL